MNKKIIRRNKITEKNYKISFAGRIWTVPKITFTAEGEKYFLNPKDLEEIQMSVANNICGDSSPLTIDELIFLIDKSGTKKSQISELLGLDPSSISKWISNNKPINKGYSLLLKHYFWNLFFENPVTNSLQEELRQKTEKLVKDNKVQDIS